MHMLSFALLAIRRYAKRYLLFGAVLVLLIAVAFCNLTIGNTADRMVEEIKQAYGGNLRIVPQSKPLRGNNYLTRAIYDRFADCAQVAEVEYRSIVRAPKEILSAKTGEAIPKLVYWAVAFNMDYTNPFNRTNAPARFLEGRMPEQADECAISAELFARLKEEGEITALGDSITRREYTALVQGGTNYQFIQTTKTCRVVGIIDPESLDAPYRDRPEDLVYVIFLPFDVLSAEAEDSPGETLLYNTPYVGEDYTLCTGYDVVYRLHDYADGPAFIREVEDRLLAWREAAALESSDALYALEGDLLSYDLRAEYILPGFNRLIPPLEQMQSFTAITTATLAILAVATVVLMCVINMRERKYELGVLRCVGMSRGKITLTLGVECLLFLAVAAILGIAAGAGIFALSGEMLIDLTVVETAIDTVAIGVDVAKWVSLAALALAVIATTVSAGFVLRARPLAILRNRT